MATFSISLFAFVFLICYVTTISGWRLSFQPKKLAAVTCASALVGCATILPSFAAGMTASPWNKDIQYEILEDSSKDAAAPKVGDLVSIRFKGSYNGKVFDDTFKGELPYIYRAGVGTILPGLDDTVVNMKVGQKVHVSFGGPLGFGEKGRPSAPGKPRIPPNAVIDYEVLLENLPGTQEDFIADADAE